VKRLREPPTTIDRGRAGYRGARATKSRESKHLHYAVHAAAISCMVSNQRRISFQPIRGLKSVTEAVYPPKIGEYRCDLRKCRRVRTAGAAVSVHTFGASGHPESRHYFDQARRPSSGVPGPGPLDGSPGVSKLVLPAVKCSASVFNASTVAGTPSRESARANICETTKNESPGAMLNVTLPLFDTFTNGTSPPGPCSLSPPS
jgi:hypothetical protein